jgi:hypothetical protein
MRLERPHARRRARLSLGRLEDRTTPSALTVTSLGDTGAAGELRQVIAQANDETNFPGEDTISFAVTGTITLTAGELLIGSQIKVTGPGAAALTISGNNTSRIFNINVTNPFAISGLTLTGGKSVNFGGAIAQTADAASLTVEDCVITGNVADPAQLAPGGGIYLTSNSSLTVRRSTIANNSARRGGGIYFFNGGSLTMDGCTVTGNFQTNSANGGGGIYFYGQVGVGGFLISNSTVSGNTASGQGGGFSVIEPQGTFTIRNSTIANNSSAAAFGGGGVSLLGTSPATLEVQSSIISGNVNADAPDIYAYTYYPSTVSVNASLIGVADAGFTFTGANNLTGTLAAPLDAKLGPLANNGGPTQTRELLAGSPAIDAGANPAGLTTDQRGGSFVRTAGVKTDIGAFEVQAANPPPTVGQVQVNGGAGAQRSVVTSLKVTFSEAVTFPNGIASAFQLNRTGPGAPTGGVNLSAVQAGDAVTLTFAAGGAVPIDKGGSLIDGAYQLTIVAANVQGAGGQLDGDGNGTGGDDFLTPLTGPGRIHRLFGDSDGDGDVDAQDFAGFRGAFGGTNPTFDSDGDGDVDAQDFAAFRARFGTSV